MAKKNLENLVEAQGVLVNSDLHGNSRILESGLSYAKDNNLIYLDNGDWINDYRLKEYSRDLGIISPEDIQNEYLASNLSQQDLEAYLIAKNAHDHGVDALVDSVSKEHREDARKQLEDVLEYSRSELFQKRISELSSRFIEEKGEEMKANGLRMRALYDVFMDEEARRFADSLNKYSDVTVLFNKGNHENVGFVENVRMYLDNKDQIVDLNEQEDVYKIRSKNKSEMSIVGMTNCVQPMQYLREIFSPEEIEILYSHMVSEKKVPKNGLDLFVTHGQVGEVVGVSNPIQVPYLESAKDLSLEAKLTVEGHIHNKYDGKNSFGKDMVRAAGEQGVVITKDKSGKLNKKWVKLGEGYDGGHNNPIPYDTEYMAMRVENRLKEYELMMQQAANDNDTQSSSKAAA